MITSLSVTLLSTVLYVLIRNSVNVWKTTTSIREVIIFIFLAPFLCITLAVAVFVVLPVAKLVKNAVDFTLKRRLGDEYGGIVRGLDVSLCAYQTKKEKSFIKSLLILEYNKKIATKNAVEYLMELLEKRISLIPDRFFCTVDEFMGYPYFKKVKIRLGDVVKKMPSSDEVLDRTQLLRAMEQCCSESLPLNGASLWDVHVGTEPLRWRANSDPNIEYYPVFVRFHHVLGDGVFLLKMMLNVLGNDEISSVIRHNPDKRTLMKNFLSFLNTFTVLPSAFYINLILKTSDTNEIHQMNQPNSGVTQFDTDENGTIFQKLKIIRKMSGAAIPEIIITAFAASLNDYFQNHCSTTPDHVAVAILSATNCDERRGENNSNNNFSFVILNAPLDVSRRKTYKQSAPLTSRLNIVRALSYDLKTSGEHQFNRLLLEHLIGSLPVFAFLGVIGRICVTSVVSLLPGPKRFSFCDGALAVSDCIFWPPTVTPIGIILSSLTFDDRLQMVIHCKCGVTEPSDARQLLDGVYKYIGLIEQEMTVKIR